ncbi:MAG: hypothetical protein Q9P01_17490, partial [Anaerolineae bacterium]|nr:hypothetical protein [Anaerolineae bacterium]
MTATTRVFTAGQHQLANSGRITSRVSAFPHMCFRPRWIWQEVTSLFLQSTFFVTVILGERGIQVLEVCLILIEWSWEMFSIVDEKWAFC